MSDNKDVTEIFSNMPTIYKLYLRTRKDDSVENVFVDYSIALKELQIPLPHTPGVIYAGLREDGDMLYNEFHLDNGEIQTPFTDEGKETLLLICETSNKEFEFLRAVIKKFIKLKESESE